MWTLGNKYLLLTSASSFIYPIQTRNAMKMKRDLRSKSRCSLILPRSYQFTQGPEVEVSSSKVNQRGRSASVSESLCHIQYILRLAPFCSLLFWKTLWSLSQHFIIKSFKLLSKMEELYNKYLYAHHYSPLLTLNCIDLSHICSQTHSSIHHS